MASAGSSGRPLPLWAPSEIRWKTQGTLRGPSCNYWPGRQLGWIPGEVLWVRGEKPIWKSTMLYGSTDTAFWNNTISEMIEQLCACQEFEGRKYWGKWCRDPCAEEPFNMLTVVVDTWAYMEGEIGQNYVHAKLRSMNKSRELYESRYPGCHIVYSFAKCDHQREPGERYGRSLCIILYNFLNNNLNKSFN